jgi:glutathione S-transferase
VSGVTEIPKLYHSGPASNGLKALIALCEKGVEFEPVYVNMLDFEQHSPEFLKINPEGQVPVLIHEGRALTESTVIAEYVDAVFPGPELRPADEWGRARMRIWTKYVDEMFRPALSLLGWSKMIPSVLNRIGENAFVQRLERIPLAEKREIWALSAKGGYSDREMQAARRRINEAAVRIEQALAHAPFLLGDEPTLADYACFAMSRTMPRLYPDIVHAEQTPSLLGWIDRLEQRPGVRRAVHVPVNPSVGRRQFPHGATAIGAPTGEPRPRLEGAIISPEQNSDEASQ